MTDVKVPCGRCGVGVPEATAKERLKQFKVVVCTDCKNDRQYLALVAKKG